MWPFAHGNYNLVSEDLPGSASLGPEIDQDLLTNFPVDNAFGRENEEENHSINASVN